MPQKPGKTCCWFSAELVPCFSRAVCWWMSEFRSGFGGTSGCLGWLWCVRTQGLTGAGSSSQPLSAHRAGEEFWACLGSLGFLCSMVTLCPDLSCSVLLIGWFWLVLLLDTEKTCFLLKQNQRHVRLLARGRLCLSSCGSAQL